MRRGRSRARARRSAALWGYALTAVIGLPARRVRQPGAGRPQRDRAASSYEAPVDAANQLQFGRAYWLPPFGRGNGLEALFWAPLAELPADRVEAVLRALGEQDIPAWAAVTGHRRAARTSPADRPHALWVASAQLDDAQDVVMRALAV
jgi:hypothetical protein